MMKAIMVGALCLGLGGCVSSVGQLLPNDITSRAKEIQTYTKAICAFVPTISTVAALITQGTSLTVTGIASDICTAVTTAPLADGPGDRKPRVGKVLIKGKFVK